MDISIIIPLLNEEESIPELASWIERVMKVNQFSYEVIFVDDGSKDDSWSIIEDLGKNDQHVKGIKFRRNYGKAAALNVGFSKATGDVVFTMDADLQDSPDEVPEMYRMIREQGYDLVSGWKKKRRDPISKTIPTKFYNWTARRISGIKLHDFNCGLKAYKQSVVKSIEVYGDMHRYIPFLAKWAGFKKIGEKIVHHQKRKFGKTKFGLDRFYKGYLDLLTITFTSRFGKRPMHFFGLWGTIIFLAGFAIAGYLVYEKVFNLAFKMTERPLFYFGLLAMVLGTQLFVAGFLGELISRSAYDRNNYLVEQYLGLEENHQ
ncbi:MAG: glycosyltransferase family 2 protein [Bacteroidales bacterium]|jgi:glycosyltransferase involved in cell wall biosynthesis|nr:glycosyltransferase family 2 protein [Bacteroidales bacterium]